MMKKTVLAWSLLGVGLGACGQNPATSELDIVNGSAVEATDPVAATTVGLMDSRHQVFCTGIMIDEELVLTAAHCLVDTTADQVQVYFGTNSLHDKISDANTREVVQLNAHSDYKGYDENGEIVPEGLDPETGISDKPMNDVGMLRIKGKKPAKTQMATLASTDEKLSVGEPLVLAGFGITAARNNVTGELRKVETAVGAELANSKEIEIKRGPLNSCNGDSGGPAYIKRDGKLVLEGVLSRGDDACVLTGIYTDVRAFANWISDSKKKLMSAK